MSWEAGAGQTARDRWRPFSRASASRYPIFLVVSVIGFLLPLLPPSRPIDGRWWAAAWLTLALAVAVTGWRSRSGRGLELPTGVVAQALDALGPLLMFPAIHFLRASDGNYFSNYGGLVVLPIAWLALYGTMAEVIAGVVGCGITLIVPFYAIGAPQFPVKDIVGEAMIVLLAAVIGPVINGLVVGRRSIASTLSRREADFRAAFENAPIGMALTAVSGPRRGYWLQVNHALTEMFGRTAEELTSIPLLELTHPDDRELTAKQREVALTSDRGRYEKRFLNASGRPFWASVSYSVVRDANGVPLHTVSQIEDIDARRESDRALLEALEADRYATERLRDLDRQRADMASAISHELRTPLTSARGYLELVLEGDAGPLTEEQRSMLQVAFRSLARLNELVKDILSAPTVEAQPPTPRPVRADLGQVIHNAVTSIALQAAARGQDLRVRNELDGVEIGADPGRLERVLVNLLTNAIKFTDEDGRIAVAGECVADGDGDGASAVISVTDTGIGIDAAEQSRIFERFYRGDATGAGSVVEGSGLGLAIVEAITTQAGGTVTVQSTPGAGSTFTVRLPLDAERYGSMRAERAVS